MSDDIRAMQHQIAHHLSAAQNALDRLAELGTKQRVVTTPHDDPIRAQASDALRPAPSPAGKNGAPTRERLD